MKLCIRKALLDLHMPVNFDFWKKIIWTPQGHFLCPPGVLCAISSKLLDEGESFLGKFKGQLMGFISATFDFWKSSLHAPRGPIFCPPGVQCAITFVWLHSFSLFFLMFIWHLLGFISDTFWFWKSLVPVPQGGSLGVPQGRNVFLSYLCFQISFLF